MALPDARSPQTGSVAGDQLAALEHQPPRRVLGDRLAQGLGMHREQVGGRADRDTAVVVAEHPARGGGGAVEGDGQVASARKPERQESSMVRRSRSPLP